MAKKHPVFGDGPLGQPWHPRMGAILSVEPDPEYARRWQLLMEHYKLQEQKGIELWANLAFALVQDFVPGLRLRPPVKKGRRKNTDAPEYADMLYDLLKRARALKQRHPAWRVSNICEQMAKDIGRSGNKSHPLHGKGSRTYTRALNEALAAEARASWTYLPSFPLPPPTGALGFGAPRTLEKTIDRGQFGFGVDYLGLAPPSGGPRNARLIRALLNPAEALGDADKKSAEVVVQESASKRGGQK